DLAFKRAERRIFFGKQPHVFHVVVGHRAPPRSFFYIVSKRSPIVNRKSDFLMDNFMDKKSDL
ncbi:MAG: hypothetical protein II163_04710, partial [Ruminococcus sp.]|nr:hypothetical protein [Ruminococcus sp.]